MFEKMVEEGIKRAFDTLADGVADKVLEKLGVEKHETLRSVVANEVYIGLEWFTKPKKAQTDIITQRVVTDAEEKLERKAKLSKRAKEGHKKREFPYYIKLAHNKRVGITEKQEQVFSAVMNKGVIESFRMADINAELGIKKATPQSFVRLQAISDKIGVNIVRKEEGGERAPYFVNPVFLEIYRGLEKVEVDTLV